MKNLIHQIIFFGLLVLISACQPAVLVQKGAVVNKTNPNFLKEAGVNEITNPHKDSNCKVCHLAPAELLTKEKPSASELLQKKQMRTDLTGLCATCHKASLETDHRVGIGTKLNKTPLPLDHQGNLNCATTCHDVHIKDPALSKKMLRDTFDALCLSCHDV